MTLHALKWQAAIRKIPDKPEGTCALCDTRQSSDSCSRSHLLRVPLPVPHLPAHLGTMTTSFSSSSPCPPPPPSPCKPPHSRVEVSPRCYRCLARPEPRTSWRWTAAERRPATAVSVRLTQSPAS